MNKEISAIIIILTLLLLPASSLFGLESSSNLVPGRSDFESGTIENISIEDEEDLRNFVDEKDLSGNGSEKNPFLLENYTIDGMGGNHSLYLENIENHFVIRNCKIYNSSTTGIKVNQTSNFTFENNLVKNSIRGIDIESSKNITIIESRVYHNDIGIRLTAGSQDNLITNNNISYNSERAVYISMSNDNLIYNNIFFENENQSIDLGDNRWDKGDPDNDGKGGNYWSGYNVEDRGDGIGEEPYEIEGDDNKDRYPLISPIGPPQDFVIQPRDRAAKLNWSEPEYSIMYDVKCIRIYRGTDEENLSIHENLTPDQDGFKDDNLTNGVEYHYSLKAINEKYGSVKTEVNSVVPDGTPPEVIDFSPDGDEVPIDTNIMVEFSKEMDEESIDVSVEDMDEDEIELEEIERDLQAESTEFYFGPKENLSYQTTYEVTVTGRDLAANELEQPHNWNFTTFSDTGFIEGVVVNQEGEPLEDVIIYFDEEHQTSTYPSGEFQIEVPSGNITLKISREGYEDKFIDYHVNQSEEKEIEDIILEEKEGIISRWFWPMALAGGGILILGMLAFIISIYHWEEEEPLTDEDIYDVDYEDVDDEEFESWWEDEDS